MPRMLKTSVGETQANFHLAGREISLVTQGTQILPPLAAQVLPDATTQFTHTERNALGSPTKEISTYTASGGVALRTNTFTYAANLIDLKRGQL